MYSLVKQVEVEASYSWIVKCLIPRSLIHNHTVNWSLLEQSKFTWISNPSCKYANPSAAPRIISNLVFQGSVGWALLKRRSSKLLLGIYSYTKSLWIPLSSSVEQYPKSFTKFGWLTTPRNWTSASHCLWPYRKRHYK